ncbi:MAG TPA: FAD-binding oxidoreductase [Marmoricola sp.]|nr:FAD-binding oxidoreductase [Marmoricola sp.]
MTEPGSDVVVVGGGIVGAACAFYATRAGLSVIVLERGAVGSGTTSRGEGNILVSDKGPGPELELALCSRRLWLELGEDLDTDAIELDEKGGLVVATTDLGPLLAFAEGQRVAGVEATPVPADRLGDLEPHLARDLPGGMHYPQDLQVQPVLAASALVRAAQQHGARLEQGVEVTAVERDGSGAVSAVLASGRRFPTGAVVNAAGTWGSEVSERLGGPVPVLPRRGFILVTEPLPRVVRHKVYSADYVDNVASSDAGLETSVVVEGTRGGTVLIGASRERVGFDTTMSVEVVRRLAGQAVRLFPFLADVALLRLYRGFRPYCPDHLPVVGADPRVPGLFHACGHEGAGIGLAPATGRLVAQLLTGAVTDVDPAAFSPERFVEVSA